MLSRITNYILGAAQDAEPPFQPHPSWLAANKANRERLTAMPDAPSVAVAPVSVTPSMPRNPVERQQRQRNTPLIHAIADGHQEQMLTLLQRGADIEERGYLGFTPLAVAAYTGNLEAARVLLARGAKCDVWSTSNTKMTPLTTAIRQGHLPLVNLLIAAGANVNACESSTYSPLMLAARFRQREMVGRLLQAGANPQVVANDGVTAEAIAAHRHDFDIVELLRMDIFTIRSMDFSLQPAPRDVPVPVMGGAVQQALDEEDQDEEYDQFFEDLLDPVTLKPIKNPIALTSGQTCDLETVQELAKHAVNGEVRCPVTRDPLKPADFTAKPNVLIKRMIEDRENAWREMQRQKQVKPQLERQPAAKESSASLTKETSLEVLRAKRMRFYGGDVTTKRPRTEQISGQQNTVGVLRR